MRSTILIRSVTLCVAFVTLPAFADDDVVIERDVMIPMRDGILLATDFYRPAVNGIAVDERLPVLLTRTPYSKSRESTVATAMHFARHGYIAAVQDMRGLYESQGVFSKYSDFEPPDGYDTVEWIAEQGWSDGRVGMWGT